MTTPTPLYALTSGPGEVWIKAEHVHPSGSVKHRSFVPYVRTLDDEGALTGRPGLVVHSAGNAGLAAAWACAQRQVPIIVFVPRSTGAPTVQRLQWLGAQVRRVASADAPRRLAELTDAGWYHLDQFGERALATGYRAIAREIVATLPSVRAVCVGVGTGGVATGVAAELRALGHPARVVGVEPAEAPMATGAPFAPHGIPGLAPPLGPRLLDRELVVDLLAVPSAQAWARARTLARREGLCVDGASGAAVDAALTTARTAGGPVVAITSGALREIPGEFARIEEV